MFHREAEVVLAICEPSYVRDNKLGNNFGDEDHTLSLHIILLAAHIKSQVYLVKIRI
jgi:hypothetical protein